jgi:hypothetical protein
MIQKMMSNLIRNRRLRFSESTYITRANRVTRTDAESETPTFSLSFGTKGGDVAVNRNSEEEIHVGNVLAAFSSSSSTTIPRSGNTAK